MMLLWYSLCIPQPYIIFMPIPASYTGVLNLTHDIAGLAAVEWVSVKSIKVFIHRNSFMNIMANFVMVICLSATILPGVKAVF